MMHARTQVPTPTKSPNTPTPKTNVNSNSTTKTDEELDHLTKQMTDIMEVLQSGDFEGGFETLAKTIGLSPGDLSPSFGDGEGSESGSRYFSYTTSHSPYASIRVSHHSRRFIATSTLEITLVCLCSDSTGSSSSNSNNNSNNNNNNNNQDDPDVATLLSAFESLNTNSGSVENASDITSTLKKLAENARKLGVYIHFNAAMWRL